MQLQTLLNLNFFSKKNTRSSKGKCNAIQPRPLLVSFMFNTFYWNYFYHLTFLIWSLNHWRPCTYRNTTKGKTDPKVFLPKQEHILEDKYINHTSDPKYLGTDSRVDSIRRFVNLFSQSFVESECWTTQRYLNGFRHSFHLVFIFIICVRCCMWYTHVHRWWHNRRTRLGGGNLTQSPSSSPSSSFHQCGILSTTTKQ